MLMHSYFMLEHVKAHQNQLQAEAEQRRVLKSARRARRAAKAEEAAARKAPRPTQEPAQKPVAGTLATCGRHVAGSAR
jgi:hypothetical protein